MPVRCICTFVCVSSSIHKTQQACGDQRRTLGVALCLLPYLRQRLPLTVVPTKLTDPKASRDPVVYVSHCAVNYDMSYPVQLLLGSGDLNSAPPIGAASAFLTH